MKAASLFTGIGGFDLAAEWMGWENVFMCEIDLSLRKFLQNRFKNSIIYEDIKQTDFTLWRNRIDILTGGFPCQPYSTAGKREGINDERHLWPEMFRAIREIKPRWIVGENVRGLVNWSKGMVFHEVQTDLENAGYEVLPVLLPAAGINAPHERYRIFFIAYARGYGYGAKCRPKQTGSTQTESQRERSKRERIWLHHWRTLSTRFTSNAANNRFRNSKGTAFEAGAESKHERKFSGRFKRCFSAYSNNQRFPKYDFPGIAAIPGKSSRNVRTQIYSYANKIYRDYSGYATKPISFDQSREIQRAASYSTIIGLRKQNNGCRKSGFFDKTGEGNYWENFPTQSPVCFGNDGFPAELVRQRIRAQSDGVITEKEIDQILQEAASSTRKAAIHAGGNAVVPQLILQIFKTIEDYEKRK